MQLSRQLSLSAYVFLVIAAVIFSSPGAAGGAEGGIIRVGGGDNYAPYHFLDDNGEPAGFDVDLAKAVAQVMDIDMEIDLGPWKRQRGGLESGGIDMLVGLALSREREAKFLFSRPYLLIQ